MRNKSLPYYNYYSRYGSKPNIITTGNRSKKNDSILTIIVSIIAVILLTGLILYGLCKITGICKEKFIKNDDSSDPKLAELKALVAPLFNKDHYFTGKLEPLNHRDFMNEIQLYVGKKSYTINKKKTYMCLRDENGNYYDNNTLLYVLLHELTHSINTGSIGHDEQFQDTFDQLLAWAVENGVYDPSKPMITNYCPGPED
jgi:hypothetical protein